MKSVLSAATFAVALPLSLGACVVVDSQGHIAREEKRFTLSGTPELRLTTFDGAIEIRAGDAKAVVVEIEKRGPTKEAIDQLTVEATQAGNRIEIAVKRPANEIAVFGIGRISSTAKLIVTMPREGHVIARSGDGSIRIEHVRGRLELRTGDGSIRATDIGGEMVVHTGDGSITFRAEPGTAMKGDWSMTTGDGGVSLYLPSDFGAELDAHTGDGAIRNELEVASETSGGDQERARRTLKGRLGAGGRTLRIRTGDGGVRLKAS